jgi:glyoxylase-like metal-dependent hydrolase (beta-lactamase superfamily II)
MRRFMAVAAAVLAIAFFAPTADAQQQQQQEPRRALTKIAGDLYRWQNNFHYGVVYVTPAGVIVGDTIDAAASTWLKDEIARQFNQPVKYVFMSHDHADHGSGAEVFAAAGATVIAHERARAKIASSRPAAAVPTVTFSDKLTLELGGKTVELVHVGRNPSDNSIVARFPAERVLFAVDFIPIKGLAFREMNDSYYPDWVESLRRVEAMEFETLTPGHGPVGTKADVPAFREYLQDLEAAVRKGMAEGKSADQLKTEVALEKYKDWADYKDFLPLNVQGMHRMLSAGRPG